MVCPSCEQTSEEENISIQVFSFFFFVFPSSIWLMLASSLLQYEEILHQETQTPIRDLTLRSCILFQDALCSSSELRDMLGHVQSCFVHQAQDWKWPCCDFFEVVHSLSAWQRSSHSLSPFWVYNSVPLGMSLKTLDLRIFFSLKLPEETLQDFILLVFKHFTLDTVIRILDSRHTFWWEKRILWIDFVSFWQKQWSSNQRGVRNHKSLVISPREAKGWLKTASAY